MICCLAGQNRTPDRAVFPLLFAKNTGGAARDTAAILPLVVQPGNAQRNHPHPITHKGASVTAQTHILIPAWVDDMLAPVEKIETHVRGLRHKAVSVFILHGGEILLQQRALGKYHTPGLWANTCCTHPHWGEDPHACAQRRLSEELGLSGLNPDYRHRLEYRADVGGGLIEHEVVDVFVVHLQERPGITANPDEVMATRWIGPDALRTEIASTPELFTPWLKIYLAEHVGDIFGSDLSEGASG